MIKPNHCLLALAVIVEIVLILQTDPGEVLLAGLIFHITDEISILRRSLELLPPGRFLHGGLQPLEQGAILPLEEEP